MTIPDSIAKEIEKKSLYVTAISFFDLDRLYEEVETYFPGSDAKCAIAILLEVLKREEFITNINGKDFVIELQDRHSSLSSAMTALKELRKTVEFSVKAGYSISETKADNVLYTNIIGHGVEDEEVKTKSKIECGTGSMVIGFDGYGDVYDQGSNNFSPIICVEIYDNELRAIIYADIDKEDPTHIISLEKARTPK